MVRTSIGLLLLIAGIGQFFWFKYSLYSLLVLMVVSFIVGLIGNSRDQRQKDSDNVAILSQIERNRYLRKPE